MPANQRSRPHVRHKLQAYEERLQSLYEQNLGLPRRERRTVLKLYEQLVEEGYTLSLRHVEDLLFERG